QPSGAGGEPGSQRLLVPGAWVLRGNALFPPAGQPFAALPAEIDKRRTRKRGLEAGPLRKPGSGPVRVQAVRPSEGNSAPWLEVRPPGLPSPLHDPQAKSRNRG